MNKEVTFHYGALSEPLEKQAKAQGLTLGDKAKHLQKLNDLMIMCWICGLCTESQRASMIKKLQKQIVSALKEVTKDD